MKLTKLNDLVERNAVVKGRWKLNAKHEIQFREEKGKNKKGFRLKGTLIGVEAGALVFSATEKQQNGRSTARLYKLTGHWQVDSKNRILFAVKKSQGKTDKLVFQGSWKVGPSHEILYSYQKTHLVTKTKTTQSLVFKGYWDISERHRLTFYVGGKTTSALRFRGTFQTKSILAKKGEIRYQIGIEVRGKKTLKTIILFGKWKLSRDFSLSFEIEYENRKRKAIVFGSTYRLGKGAAIEARLKARTGKPLGAELLLTKDIFAGDGQLFGRLYHSLEETGAEAGVRIKF